MYWEYCFIRPIEILKVYNIYKVSTWTLISMQQILFFLRNFFCLHALLEPTGLFIFVENSHLHDYTQSGLISLYFPKNFVPIYGAYVVLNFCKFSDMYWFWFQEREWRHSCHWKRSSSQIWTPSKTPTPSRCRRFWQRMWQWSECMFGVCQWYIQLLQKQRGKNTFKNHIGTYSAKSTKYPNFIWNYLVASKKRFGDLKNSAK